MGWSKTQPTGQKILTMYLQVMFRVKHANLWGISKNEMGISIFEMPHVVSPFFFPSDT